MEYLKERIDTDAVDLLTAKLLKNAGQEPLNFNKNKVGLLSY